MRGPGFITTSKRVRVVSSLLVTRFCALKPAGNVDPACRNSDMSSRADRPRGLFIQFRGRKSANRSRSWAAFTDLPSWSGGSEGAPPELAVFLGEAHSPTATKLSLFQRARFSCFCAIARERRPPDGDEWSGRCASSSARLASRESQARPCEGAVRRPAHACREGRAGAAYLVGFRNSVMRLERTRESVRRDDHGARSEHRSNRAS
jgi:hypothetical protein